MKKIVIAIVAIIIAIAGGLYFLKKPAKAPSDTVNPQNQAAPTAVLPTPSGQATPSPTANLAPQSGGGETTGSNVQVTEVDFDGTNFSPNTVNIYVNDYVFFKNKSSGDFWPLAGSANTMAAYPNFNAGKPIAAGGEYKFQFTKAGTFSYGDNLHSNAAAIIVVSQ